MIEAERQMRDSLAAVSLHDLARRTARKIPNSFAAAAGSWFAARQIERGGAPRKHK